MGITDHLAEIRGRIARAEAQSARAGDPPGRAGALPAGSVAAAGDTPAPPGITLVGASKGQPAATVREGLAAGLRDYGENYVQEALPKIAAVGHDVVWHFIGRIQSNKTREVATHFAWAQTVTSARIARRLSDHRPHFGDPLQVCIQIAAGSIPERGGCPQDEVVDLAAYIASLPRLKLRGLMLLPAEGLEPDALRVEYRAAATLLERLNGHGHALDTLSMGMSGDFELAIAGGSTMVRVGTALFGPRVKQREGN